MQAPFKTEFKTEFRLNSQLNLVIHNEEVNWRDIEVNIFRALWLMPLSPELGKQRWVDLEFKASLVYIGRPKQ